MGTMGTMRRPAGEREHIAVVGVRRRGWRRWLGMALLRLGLRVLGSPAEIWEERA
jgi:hypothetical protein